MKTIKGLILACTLAALPLALNAQLWIGTPLPPAWGGSYGIDSYFVPGGGGLSEFDMDSGFDFSLSLGGTVPIGITEAGGWFSSANFGMLLQTGDTVKVTFLGNTAGWNNDFGLNRGGTNATGPGASTLWKGVNQLEPNFGSQISFVQGAADPALIDFWLNSGGPVAPALGGTYSMFYPGTSIPTNTGPGYSARGRVFNVNDSIAQVNRSVLVIAIEDWRSYDADFTDMFFAIEIGTRFGGPQFGVPEPSTYGLIGAMVLLGLAAVRRKNRS